MTKYIAIDGTIKLSQSVAYIAIDGTITTTLEEAQSINRNYKG